MKDECYEFIKNQIGKTNIVGFGSYGEVKIARNTQNNQIVAVKLIHGKNAKQQIDVHHKLNHPNIIKLLNYYYQKQKNITYMVLQYAENGSLNQKIKFNLGQLSKQLIKKYFKGVCQAIKYLHKHNYMHRDIKPENILITKDNIAKLCDFGFAAMFESRTTMCGTFQYMAPQMIKKKHYTYKIDIWALGILLFQMIQGIAPFRGQTGEEVITQMKKPIKFSQRFDSEQIDLIKKILRVNAQNRPNVQQILQHSYFKSHKQEEKINHGRGTVENISKSGQQQNQIKQSTLLVKQQTSLSKEQLNNFFKQNNDKPTTKIIDKNKPQKPYRQFHIKTQPSSSISTQSKDNSLITKLIKVNNERVNNEQSQMTLKQQFKKIGISNKQTQSNKYLYSPQVQNKSKSPLNSSIEGKVQFNILSLNNLKSHKRVNINNITGVLNKSLPNTNSNLANLNNNFTSQKTVNGDNKNKISSNQMIEAKRQAKQQSFFSKKIPFTNAKNVETYAFNQQKLLNNDLSDKKAPTQTTVKPFVNTIQSGYRYENISIVNPGLNPVKNTNVSTSLKYPGSKVQNNNGSYYLNQNNTRTRNDQECFSPNQFYNLQKSVNNANSSFNKLK